jgi:rRNA maturation RNase YbeY
MPVKFFNEEIKFNLKYKILLKNWIKNTIATEKFKTGAINYIFISPNEILRINREYLNHDYFTDIITFNYCENSIINGDIYICIDTVKNNSSRFDVTFIEELHRVMIHGILHLVGYNDQNDDEKAIMREKENFYLERLKNLF